MAAVKPLYLAGSLEELNKKVNKSDKMKQSSPKMLCRIADKILLKAKDELLAGDEEQAYILYMRFIDIYKIIRSSKEFKKDKAEINQLLPTSKVNKALDSAELLSGTLKGRYSELNSDPGTSTSSEEPSSDQVVPSSPKPHPSTAGQQPLVPFSLSSSETTPTSSNLHPLSPKELYQLLTQQPEKVLVLDCRPRAEYNASHPDTKKKFPQWLCLPEESVRNGVTDKSVMAFLSLAGKERWKGRAKVKYLVLVDDHSTAESLGPDKGEGQATPLLALRDALFKYATGEPLTSPPYLLEGGYAMWYLTYGVTCVGIYKRKAGGGDVATPPKTAPEGGVMDYPSFPDIKETPDVGVASSETVIEMEEGEPEQSGATPLSLQATPPSSQAGPSHMDWHSQPPPTQTNWSNQAPPTTQMDWQHGTSGGVNFPHSMSVDAVVPPFMGVASAPLPPPPSAIPVALALEGENGLIAPTLSSEHDLLSDYPQLLRTEEEEEEPFTELQLFATVPVPTYTQPQSYNSNMSQGQPQPEGLPMQHVPTQQGSNLQQHVPQGVVLSSQSSPQLSQHSHQQHLQIQASVLPSGQPLPPQNFGGNVLRMAPQVQPPQNMGGPGQQMHPRASQAAVVPQPGAQQPIYQQVLHPAAPQPTPQSHSVAQWNQGGQTHPDYSGSQPHPQPHPQQPRDYSGSQPHPQPHPQQPRDYSGSQPHPQPHPQQPRDYSGSQPHPQPHPQQPHDYSGSQPHPQPHLHPQQVPLNQQQVPYTSPQQIPANQPHPPTQPHPQQAPPTQPQPAPPTQPHPQHQEEPCPQQAPTIKLNPRVAIGPMPRPPSYEQARVLPALPFVDPPLPPPISMPSDQAGRQEVFNNADTAVSVAEPRPQQVAAVQQEPRPQQQEPHPPQQEPRPSSERSGEVNEAMELLRREREKMQELRAHMETKMGHLEEVRVRQEQTAKQLQVGQAELAAQRQSHQLEVQQSKKEIAEMKRQFDESVASMAIEKQRYLQLQEEEKKKKKQERSVTMQQHVHNRELAQRAGLPVGWEKRLDHKTGRYYYVDHSTLTTHWNPPAQLINYQKQLQDEAAAKKQQEQTRLQQINRANTPAAQPGHVTPQPGHVTPQPGHVTPQPGHMTPTALPRPGPVTHPVALPQPAPPPSAASQGLPTANQVTTPTPAPTNQPAPSKPTVDRTVKPQAQKPTVDRSNKPEEPRPPLWSPEESRLKEHSLQPVFGAERQLLTGLRNLGNTCFMNSTLQCLGHTSTVMPYFTSLGFQKDINYFNPIGHKGAVAKEFSWLMRALWSGRYKSVTPRDFKSMVDQYIPDMQGYAQQDAQEFLAFLMNALHEDLNRVKQRVSIQEPGRGMEEGKMARLVWENHLKRNNSVIVDFFQGMYRSTVICNNCKKRSVTFEPFMYLSLPIPPGQRPYTLQDCLHLFSERETVSWNCAFCRSSAGATKKLEIWKLPYVLLIAFNRFTNDGLWKEKRQNYIDYPVGKTLLNLSGYVVGEKPKVGYRLYAVSNHFGTQSGGHYTACCLNPYNQTYYNFDDHEVREASAKQVKSGAGYLLFYTSLEHRPPKARF